MKKILIVEDEYLEQEFLRTVVQEEIEKQDEIFTCETGTQAVSLARKHKPDIIIMDILIPEMDGLRAIQEIRTFLTDTVILVISACSDFSYAQTAISCGVFEYLLKPVKPAKFKQTFKNALEKAEENTQVTDEFFEKTVSTEKNVDRQYFVEEAIKYIRENFKEKLTLQMVASYIYMNPQYFSRVFKKEVGVTYTDFVNDLKIQYACKLLEITNYPAYRISGECGFTDPSYFNRVFYRQMQMTPKEYKKKIQMASQKTK